ncbi:MAG: tetratricopeptide repeat protein [Desulfobulbaceae bacterium]|nr:tetratricopeptide repeat protein [Desulfobulbaceae bacterium]
MKFNVQYLLLFCLIIIPLSSVYGQEDCDEARKWYLEGMSLLDNSNREASYYKKALEFCPNFSEALNRLGEVYLSQGSYDEAENNFNHAVLGAYMVADESLAIKPGLNLGELFKRRGKYDRAIEEYIRVLEIDAQSRVANSQLEYLYKKTGKYADVTSTPQDMLTNATFTRISGMTLPKGAYFADFQYKYWVQKSTLTSDMFVGDVPLTGAPPQREAHVNLWILGLRYGFSNSLTAGIIPKYFTRKSIIPIESQDTDAEPEAAGLGDTVVMFKYLFNGVRTSYFSGVVLFSLPTGDDGVIDEDKGLTRKIPLGSGSLDTTLGLAYSSRFDPVTLHGNLTYTLTDGELVGDSFTADLGVAYPLNDYVHSALELNYRWRDTIITDQYVDVFVGRPEEIGPSFAPVPGGMDSVTTKIEEQGGSILFLSPSVQFFLDDNFKVEVGLQVPIVKPDSGWAEESVFHLGISKLLN